MDKKNIIRNFSRYAYAYDKYADVQKIAALELLSQINPVRNNKSINMKTKISNRVKENSFKNILELGCGTGNYTILLREKFRQAKFKAIDISDKMIEVAKNKLKDKFVEFIIADAEDLNLKETFDFITSNACFQWLDDLEKALIKYKNLLKKNGIITFSLFGPLTFQELDASLKYILKNATVSATNFITKQNLKNLLNINFKEVKVKETRYEEFFPNLHNLLNKIKYTGIRGDGFNSKIYFSPKLLKKVEKFYLNKFKQIKATYQVFFCRGIN